MGKKYDKIFKCAILLIMFILITEFLKRYFKGAFILIVLVLFCKPICQVLSKNFKFKKGFSAILSLSFINLIFFVVVFKLGISVVDNFQSLLNLAEEALRESQSYILSIFASALEELDFLREGTINLRGLFNGNFIASGAKNTGEGILSYFIANICTYFVLVDFEGIREFLCKLIYEENVVMIARKYREIKEILFIEGKLVIFATIETIFGFLALNIPKAILLGVICGILDLLPYVGTIIVFIPLIIYKIIMGEYIIAFGLTMLYLLLVVSRQVMEAKFISSKLKIHPLPLILSLYIGLKIFGILGIIIGPIYVITAKEIIW